MQWECTGQSTKRQRQTSKKVIAPAYSGRRTNLFYICRPSDANDKYVEVSCADFEYTLSNDTSKLLYEFCVLGSFQELVIRLLRVKE